MFLTKALTLTTTLALVIKARGQSVDPGIGVNPKAQGATEDVTPGTGPNG